MTLPGEPAWQVLPISPIGLENKLLAQKMGGFDSSSTFFYFLFFLWATDDFTVELSQHVVVLFSSISGKRRYGRHLCSISPTETVPLLLGYC